MVDVVCMQHMGHVHNSVWVDHACNFVSEVSEQ